MPQPQPSIDPSVYDDLLLTGLQSANIDPQVLRQQEIAKRLRADTAPSRVAYQSGRRAVAPHPMEYLAGLVGQGVAGAREQQADQLTQQQQAIRMRQVQAVLAALKAQRAMGTPSPEPAPDYGGAPTYPGSTTPMP
jgi:hypothetical protein